MALTLTPGCGESSNAGSGANTTGGNPTGSSATNTGKNMNTTDVSTNKTDPQPKNADGSANKEDTTKKGDDTKKEETPKPQQAVMVIAGGCFWCVEAVFEELEGVISAESGYAGGTKETANYEAVCTGLTKHAEAVRIHYDPSKISYEKLLAVHFATHDPTTLNQQGADKGPQYRSAIFFASDEEKKVTEAMIDRLNESGAFPRKIVTTLEPLTVFYLAEKDHQDFVCNNPLNGYVRGVAMPKVDKVRHKFKDELKEKSPLKE
ncbi:MAG: peptide-methionine (S)-S-oxide reductase MsrA [Phycisphaeraceae bacterium]